MPMDFWKDKRVLITGFRGFLGSHLTKSLISRGADITGLDIRTDINTLILGKEDIKKIRIVKGDVADYKLVKKTLDNDKIEIIFHLAAHALVGDCLENPKEAFETNICGTWNILEASRKAGKNRVKAIIVSSSDKAYGDQKELPYREGSPLRGNHPYDVSKSCADLLANAYFHTYNLPVCVTRCGNIFGPGDMNFSRIVPSAIVSAINDKTLPVRSDGRFVRDYVYIDDIVDGYALLAEKLQKLKLGGEAFNLSYENPISVLGLVKMIYRLTDKTPKYRILNKAKYEIRKQYLSSRKARRVLGWRPKYGLHSGMKITVNWYKDVVDR